MFCWLCVSELHTGTSLLLAPSWLGFSQASISCSNLLLLLKLCAPTVCSETHPRFNANPVSLQDAYPREVKTKGLDTQQVSALPKQSIKLQLTALSLVQEKLQCPTH